MNEYDSALVTQMHIYMEAESLRVLVIGIKHPFHSKGCTVLI